MFRYPHSKPSTQTPDDGKSPTPATGRDRGPAAFFHGREDIISRFETVLSESTTLKAGATFLIQGAPGAGKTALLDQLRLVAEDRKWKTAEIDAPALWDVKTLRESIPDRNILKKLSGKVNAGLPEVGSIEISVKDSAETIKKVLKSGRKPLLLILDEAQMLGGSNKPVGQQHTVAANVLKAIHNGRLDRPVILLAAGLGTTKSAFNSLGISRFEGESLINLGRLDKDSEYEVIRDWLTEAGGAIDDPTPWIETISEQTHGWPQHIISYIKPATSYVKSNNHQMTDAGLRIVLEKGAERRAMCYRQRAHGIDKRKRQVLAKTFNDIPLGDTMMIDDIKSSLKQAYSKEAADNLFKQALEQGIIDKNEDGYYGVPIPSMQTWLIEAYGRKQIDMPKIEDESPKPEKDHQSGVVRGNATFQSTEMNFQRFACI